jgi:YD repeat-containing protein
VHERPQSFEPTRRRYTYSEHGELATETDARNIVTTRTTDALDRVTAVSYPNATLNTTYTYDTGAFGKGRLTGLARHGETLASTYDRFGRVLQDGTLAYTWDKNGNRTTITYPETITATYGHDFADREATLTVQVGANPPLQLVNGATYEPFGPLKTLALGNGLTETHSSAKAARGESSDFSKAVLVSGRRCYPLLGHAPAPGRPPSRSAGHRRAGPSDGLRHGAVEPCGNLPAHLASPGCR